nr:hypothetical protein [Tanacetum cinerariifolium]
MSGKDQVVDATALPKFDMPLYESEMTTKDVKSLAIRYDIPLDLHPIALTKGWTMDQLSDDMIVLYEQYFEFSGVVPSVNLFRVFYKVSKQGHWFSFEKRVGKGAGGQVFRETFSGLKEWKKRFFFLNGRAIPDALAWRHHDYDVSDPVLEDGFSASDVHTLTERVVDFRHVPSGLLFRGGGHYVRIPSLPFLKRVEVEDPKIVATREMKTPAAAKKREKRDNVVMEGRALVMQPRERKLLPEGRSCHFWVTSSPKPIRTVTETVKSRKDRFPRVSLPGSANRSIHNYSDTHVNEETDTLRLGTSGDQSGRAMTNVNTEVVQPSPMHRPTRHCPTATRSASSPWSIQRVNVEAGESSSRASLYVPDWSIHQRCRLDTHMWCQELMVHLAPPATQEESNALNNATALERAWFSLAREALAKTDILERFERLLTDFNQLVEAHSECGEIVGKLVQARLDLAHSSHLYTTLSDRYTAVKSDHEGCARQREVLEGLNSELSQVNKDQTLRIKELDDELARKDSALVFAE